MTRKKGFTILELLVVVAIIGILAVIALVNYNAAKAKSRDSKRLSDAETIATAIVMYREDMDTTIVTMPDGSMTGNNGWANGSGWFNCDQNSSTSCKSGYTNSISSGLVARGYLNAPVLDPSGCVQSTSTSCYTYMFYSQIGANGTVYAKLEKPTPQMSTDCSNDTGTNHCSLLGTSYGMNYFVRK